MTKPIRSSHTRAIASPRITASPKMPFAHPSPSSYDNRLKTALYVLLALIGAIVLYLLVAPLFRTQKSGGESASPKASSEGRLEPQASSQLSRAMNAASGGDGVATTGHPMFTDADGNLAQASNLTLDREHNGGKIIFGGGKASISGRNDDLENNDADGRMHIYSSEKIHLIPKDDVIILKNGGGDGRLYVNGNTEVTKKITAGETLCINRTCLTQDHLKMLTGEKNIKIQSTANNKDQYLQHVGGYDDSARARFWTGGTWVKLIKQQ